MLIMGYGAIGHFVSEWSCSGWRFDVVRGV